jgi:hypothetical protein
MAHGFAKWLFHEGKDYASVMDLDIKLWLELHPII